MSRNSLGLAATALIAMGALAGVMADAATVPSVATTVKIDSGGASGAQGHVSSPVAKCKKNRKVTLYVVPPPPGYAQPQPVGTDRTDPKGKWSVSAQLFAGDYIAKVAPKTITVAGKGPVHGKRKKCRRATSPKKQL